MAKNTKETDRPPIGTSSISNSILGHSAPNVTRRKFLAAAGASTAVIAGTGLPGLTSIEALAQSGGDVARAATKKTNRVKESFKVRADAAKMARARALVDNVPLADETTLPNFIGNYSKALPHNQLGEVDADAYNALVDAATSGEAADFAAIPLGGSVKLENPQAGLAYDLMGGDSHHLFLPTPPSFSSAETAGEMVEDYWMALCRDVRFADFETDPLIARAAADISNLSDFKGPKSGGQVTASTIFRGSTAGDLTGPFVSQFLLKDIGYGAQTISATIKAPMAGVDYMTDYDTWLAIQNGQPPASGNVFDAAPRYITTMRDLGQYAHIDALFQPYLNACLLLLGFRTPADSGLPSRTSANQTGFVEFGGPHALSLVTEVATRGLKAMWYHKWFVHRRLRPEVYSGRVHNHITGAAEYPIHGDVLNSDAVSAVFDKFGTYLLPMAYPEGSPTHPAYGAGHAVVAGVCTTVLKAFFDESFVVPSPVVPNEDGSAVVPYEGGPLTVGNELNKLAANIALARDMGGVHWRTDGIEGILLGERLGITILEEQKLCHNQSFSYSLTKFDGTTITI